MNPVNEVAHELPVEVPRPEPTEVDLLDLLLVLAARKRLVFWTTLACAAIAALVVFVVLRPMYTGKAAIMPPQQEQSSLSSLMGQLGSLASIAGLSSGGNALGLKNPNDLYIGLLKSNTIADSLIKQFGLMHLYHDKKLSQARHDLADRSDFESGKDSLIDISVEDHDPGRAAAMANAYVKELENLNNHLAITEASQRRLFFEQQLAQEKDRLADAEVALQQTEESTGAILPTGQTEAIIAQIAQLQAQITSREVQLDALSTSSTEQNPDVVRLNTELDGLREKLQALENGQAKHTPGNISIPTANVPAVGLEYIRKERDVKYHQFLFDLLARQYEAARIDEAKAAPVIQVVDPASTPDRKSGPARVLWTIAGGLFGFLFGCAWVIVARGYRRIEADAIYGQRMSTLKQELGLK